MAAKTKPAAQEPLDKLEAELGSVLFQLGKIFKHAHQGDRNALEQAKGKAKKGIPEAESAFQAALELVKQDLDKVRIVVGNDLKALRERRAAREKAAGAARLQTSNAANASAANGKPVKKEPNMGNHSTTDIDMSDAPSGLNGQLTADKALEEAAAAVVGEGEMPPDLESLFAVDGFGDVGTAGDLGTAGGQHGDSTDTQMDDLFGDDDNFDGGFGMGGDGAGDGISNLIPQLEKYVNQGQDGENTNGQNAGNGAEEIDLDDLLDGFTDSNDTKPALNTAQTEGGKGNEQGKGNSNDNGKSSGTEKSAANDNALENKEDDSAENTNMEFDFDDFGLTGGGNVDTMSGSNGIDDWFNFD